MALEDHDSIDIVLGPSRHAKLTLVAVDGRPHDDADVRFDLLARKLQAYLAYLSDPGFSQKHPGLRPSDALICVVCHDPPTEAMRQIQFVRPSGDPDPDHRVRVVFANHKPGQGLPEPDYFSPA